MSNALVPKNRTALAQHEVDPFASAGEDMGGGNALYMKFNGNSGEFTYGAEQETIELGSKLAVNMASFRRGWICWVNEAVVEETMKLVTEGAPPQKSELTDHGPYVQTDDRKDGWTEQAAVTFRDLATGVEYLFKTSSKSGLRGLGTLLKDYGKVYKTHPGELAIVELANQGFFTKVKAHGKKFAPKFPIVEWANEEELLAQHGDNPEDYQEGDGEQTDADDSAEDQTPEPTPSAAAQTEKPKLATGAAGAPRRKAF